MGRNDNTNIEAYCDEVGIKHEVSVTYTPQQNGVVERKNRTLITLARTMLDEYNTPKLYGWKLSTPHAMHPTAYSFKSFLARPLMSCSMGRSRTSHSSGCLVVNVTSTRSGNTLGSFKDVVILAFLLVTHQSPKHIEYLIMPSAWLKNI